MMPKEPIPHFETDEEAAEFWDTHSFADYWDEFEEVDPDTFRGVELVLERADGTRVVIKPRSAAGGPET